MAAALQKNGWFEEEESLAEHWDEMRIRNPAIPVAGVWKDGMYICIYCDPAFPGSAGSHF